jgi:hypothetical protein
VRWVVLAVVCAGRVASAECVTVADTPVTVATAALPAEFALTVSAQSASATSWGEAGNEAVVLEVSTPKRGLVGHLILHQGRTRFAYGMHVGAVVAGDTVQLRVSKLSAAKAKPEATVCDGKLVDVSTLGDAADGVIHAPEFRWPVQKAFNDAPLVVAWSKSHKSYTTVMTNEDGGTAEQCGGGAAGMQAEIARWGRSTDIEDHYKYGGRERFERCTGDEHTALRHEGTHPVLYWGNGHNRLFESRGGYGKLCGARLPEKPDGDLDGWNVKNPSNALADDAGRVIVLRPLPVDLDALDYAKWGARREAIADHFAPWMYRLTALELAREGKLDDKRTLPMERYLYVDVKVRDVGGEGGTYCAAFSRGGFKLRAVTLKGETAESAQITAKYAFGGHEDWKRVAIPLAKGMHAADIDHFVFDAYDNDGIYVTGIGDAFIPKPDGDNGATLDYVRKGQRALSYYVDDDRSACPAGSTCPGGQVELPAR